MVKVKCSFCSNKLSCPKEALNKKYFMCQACFKKEDHKEAEKQVKNLDDLYVDFQKFLKQTFQGVWQKNYVKISLKMHGKKINQN